MKNNKLFTRVIAAAAIAAIALTTVTVASPKNVHAAEITSNESTERIISDENATAHINADGSGYIELNKTFTSDDRLTQIGGVDLKNIITFNDGGYVESFYSFVDSVPCILAAFAPNGVIVYGSGPKGFFSGAGHLHFTDKTNDTYNLSIWLHDENFHQVRYSSSDPTITKISWNS
jgi:hypothetical protein